MPFIVHGTLDKLALTSVVIEVDSDPNACGDTHDHLELELILLASQFLVLNFLKKGK